MGLDSIGGQSLEEGCQSLDTHLRCLQCCAMVVGGGEGKVRRRVEGGVKSKGELGCTVFTSIEHHVLKKENENPSHIFPFFGGVQTHRVNSVQSGKLLKAYLHSLAFLFVLTPSFDHHTCSTFSSTHQVSFQHTAVQEEECRSPQEPSDRRSV